MITIGESPRVHHRRGTNRQVGSIKALNLYGVLPNWAYFERWLEADLN